MSKDDIDVGIVFQKEELKELIAAISAANFISNMTVFPTNQLGIGTTNDTKMRLEAELNEAMEDWENEEMGKKLWAHLRVLQDVLDNETN